METNSLPRVIFVDDEPSILATLRRQTHKMEADCIFFDRAAKALEYMESSPCDVVVSDMSMPEMNGVTFLEKVADKYPDTIRIVLTAFSDEETVMSVINQGRIWGYLKKPCDSCDLLMTVNQALQAGALAAERALLRETLKRYKKFHKTSFEGFVGSSPAMQMVYNIIERAAPSNASVFITGPSGTGKEVAAEAIHHLSERKAGPFVALNCAAIPSELMESEIFGHVKGAFSGAVSSRDGAAHQANGGTLFLDELGELDISLQAKLLRFIQTGMVQKIGASKLEKVDIRFVCATNRNPLEAIEEQLLREDLYYRLNVISIAMPPLSDRDEDAFELARFFLNRFSKNEGKEFSGFSQGAKKVILSYNWPGNVRQLQNCIHNTVVMSNGPLITEQILSDALQIPLSDLLVAAKPPTPVESEVSPEESKPDHIAIRKLAEIEKEAIQEAVLLLDGNVVNAAKALGVSPSTLYRKIQTWEIQK